MKNKIQIGIILLTVVIVLGFVFMIRTTKKHVHDLPSIKESGRLSVLTDSCRLGFSIEGDSVFGFQYEIVKAFADSLGLELEITEKSDMKECVEDLNNADYDIIANFMPITTEWKENVLFSNSFFTTHQVLVQNLNTDTTGVNIVKSHFQLANDTIHLPINSPYKMRIINLSNEIAHPIYIIEMKKLNTEQLVRQVAIGKMKYTICDDQLAKRMKLEYPNLDVSLPIGFEQQQAWVVDKKSTLLLEKLNSFLSNYIGSTDYWKAYRRYY